MQRPRFLRGMLPYGVRTFLWQASRLTSDRLPSRIIYHDRHRRKENHGYALIRPSPGAEAGTRGRMSPPIDTCSIRIRRVLFLFLIGSIYSFKPMREKKLFLRRQKRF